MRSKLLTILLLPLIGGCAGGPEVRSLAHDTSAVLNQYRQEMSTFARRQTVLRQDNQRRLANIVQLRQEHDAEAARTLLGWRLGNESEAIALYNLATATDAAAVQSGSEALRLIQPAAASAAAVRFDAAQVEALIKRLRVLDQPPSFWDRLAFGISYSQSLQDAYAASLAHAGEEAAAAGTTPQP